MTCTAFHHLFSYYFFPCVRRHTFAERVRVDACEIDSKRCALLKSMMQKVGASESVIARHCNFLTTDPADPRFSGKFPTYPWRPSAMPTFLCEFLLMFVYVSAF